MPIHTFAMMKILNPHICVKNVSFHSYLIVKVYLTDEWAFVVAVFHHLIVFFTLSIPSKGG